MLVAKPRYSDAELTAFCQVGLILCLFTLLFRLFKSDGMFWVLRKRVTTNAKRHGAMLRELVLLKDFRILGENQSAIFGIICGQERETRR
jgi:hypothetical protein